MVYCNPSETNDIHAENSSLQDWCMFKLCWQWCVSAEVLQSCSFPWMLLELAVLAFKSQCPQSNKDMKMKDELGVELKAVVLQWFSLLNKNPNTCNLFHMDLRCTYQLNSLPYFNKRYCFQVDFWTCLQSSKEEETEGISFEQPAQHFFPYRFLYQVEVLTTQQGWLHLICGGSVVCCYNVKWHTAN